MLNTKTWTVVENLPMSKQVADEGDCEESLSEEELPGLSGLADRAGGDLASSYHSSDPLSLKP